MSFISDAFCIYNDTQMIRQDYYYNCRNITFPFLVSVALMYANLNLYSSFFICKIELQDRFLSTDEQMPITYLHMRKTRTKQNYKNA